MGVNGPSAVRAIFAGVLCVVLYSHWPTHLHKSLNCTSGLASATRPIWFSLSLSARLELSHAHNCFLLAVLATFLRKYSTPTYCHCVRRSLILLIYRPLISLVEHNLDNNLMYTLLSFYVIHLSKEGLLLVACAVMILIYCGILLLFFLTSNTSIRIKVHINTRFACRALNNWAQAF